MESRNKAHCFAKKYSKQCPKCRAVFLEIWKECATCGVPLIDFRLALLRLWVRKTIIFFVWMFVLLAGTYWIQRAERALYIQSWQDLSEGKVSQSREVFLEAFRHHPLFKARRISLELYSTLSQKMTAMIHFKPATPSDVHESQKKIAGTASAQKPKPTSTDFLMDGVVTPSQEKKSKNRF